MNPQQAGFVASYPPPQHDFAQFGYPYPPPGTQPQQIPAYQYHPQQLRQQVPPHSVQAQYLQQQSFRPAPQTISQPQPPPQQQARQPQPQYRPQAPPPQPNAPTASPPAPGTGPGAPPLEPSSSLEENQDENNVNDEPPQPQYGPNGSDEHGAIFNIPPPPEATYPNEEALENAIHAWSKDHGYELVRRASKRNAKGVLYKRYYHCSKHGKKANTGKLTDETRQRVNRKSGRVDCPMSLAAVAVDPTDPEGEWQIRHRKGHHNHAPARAMELAGHRRRARMGEVEKVIDGLFAIGTGTAQVLQFLQKANPEGLFTRTDVANMKNRYRKWGTCADRIQRGENHVSTVKYKNQLGIPIPCISCRQKKLVCGMERPLCTICQQSGTLCQYSHEQPDDDDADEVPSAQIDLTSPTGPQAPQQSNASAPPAPITATRSKSARPAVAQQEQTAQTLASLQTFPSSTTNSNLPIQRLTLESSSVEMLVQSSCGNGDSYLSLSILHTEKEWPAFRDAMVAVAMKDNTYDVLTGLKGEPLRPPGADVQLIEVEVWNEYIKQLAVFKRRNDLLLSALLSKTGAMFRIRISGLQKAADAWALLEGMCAPRGSESAYRLYDDLFNITLATSTSLHNYISRLESAWTQFKQLKLQLPHTGPGNKGKAKPAVQQQKSPQTGGEVVTDESMVFLFLRGLGPEWTRWVEGFCATSNLAGFGTGERVGFKEVGRAALRAEGGGRKGAG